MANNKMTASQIKKMKDIINDPIKWAQAFIRIYDASKKQDTPWIARWYQGEALRDKSLRKVLRQGRRTGKCLPGWVKILDPTTGKLNTIEEIYNNKKCNLVTMNKDYKLEKHKTNIIFKNGIKKVYRIKLESGREIDATDNHPLYSRCGWTEVRKLIPGNYVAVPKILNYFGNKTMDLKKIKDLALNSSKECVPKDIFELEKNNIAYYLYIIFSYGIFTAYDKDIEPQIVKDCESKELSIDIQHLLLRFGINSVLYEKEKSKADGYYLIIKGKHNLQLFKDKIGLKNRNQELDYCINNSTTKEIKNNEQDVVYEKILSIKYIDKVMTYDLTVPITHNFIANDIITHNTEEMVIEMLWRVFTNRNYRCLTVTPYENQVRLQFQRIREIIDSSPLLKNEVVSLTKNPYALTLKNNSTIFGFTTGAASGSGAASIRGQRADWVFMDEVDYMADSDFDTVTAIAAERSDIGITMSSTPTGKRSHFYAACTKPEMGYTEHYHPSTHNPNWGPRMEAEFRAQLSEQGYIHEVLAEFGVENEGVFNKDKVDLAISKDIYAYNDLDIYQKEKCERNGIEVEMCNYDNVKRAPMNIFRTIGVDWDKFKASSSILILDYDLNSRNFKVIKTIEIPRAQYSYDLAVNTIVELNDKYNPAWIYCDAGAGEYQIERLHIIGEERPSTGLANKVKRIHFAEKIDIIDPVTKQFSKKPLKSFMVTQLQILFDREQIILSPFDETLYKQLIDYVVEKISNKGEPIFTSENEHFVDALGLAYLAMVLEFKDLTNMIKDPESTTKIKIANNTIGKASLNRIFEEIECDTTKSGILIPKQDLSDRRGDRQTMFKVPLNYNKNSFNNNWGTRKSGLRTGSTNRTMW